MQKTFLIATHNKKKKNELLRILSPLGIDVKTDEELNLTLTEPDENGETFYENALIKAQSGCKESGLPCVADDSGLMVDYLAGAPGVYSARFSGEHGNDKKNNEKLLKLLKDVPEDERTARFVSVVCCVFPNGDILSARGECEGKIGYEEKGEGGFGYDPVFMVDGKSFAEISSDEKDKLSHRGKALNLLSEKLNNYMSL
ncbi:MAG: RdgB/HAM1 family non-canonical purine NTP pyrophosphatase [Ruminococcaceae bacterium]|nr:RdgB/HAM1 family non-canonical purine NTP pyrophosphatase [Oscillospiraceae bacterium]